MPTRSATPPVTVPPETPASPGLPAWLTIVFAVSCGAFVANLYYAQALITVIGPALGLHGGLAGWTVTMTQLGYAAGLLFLVSLADLVENRRLIAACIVVMTLGLAGAAAATSATAFLVASFAIGVGSVAAQIIVPLAAHLSHEHRRGQTIGNVMGGLVTGIMLARPLANLIASAYGWRAVFGLSGALGLAIGVGLWCVLPTRHPRSGTSYTQILVSTWQLLGKHRVLRRRAAYQAIVFGAFNLFWTAAPLVLTQTFRFDQRGIAFFALAGAGGALAAPLAGRLADRGATRVATAGALATLFFAFALAGWSVWAKLASVLVVAAIALDAATQTNQIVGQRAIYAIDAAARGRINAVYMTGIFIAGAAGSLLASIVFAAGGWAATSFAGCGLAVVALLLFAVEVRSGAGDE